MTLEDSSAIEKEGEFTDSLKHQIALNACSLFILLYVPDIAFKMFIPKDQQKVPRLVIRIIVCAKKNISLKEMEFNFTKLDEGFCPLRVELLEQLSVPTDRHLFPLLSTFLIL